MAVMPALFFGHGNPMNALVHNPFTEGWSAIGQTADTQGNFIDLSALVCPRNRSHGFNTAPRTIHDFGGFPRELYEFSIRPREIPSCADRFRNCSRLSCGTR